MDGNICHNTQIKSWMSAISNRRSETAVNTKVQDNQYRQSALEFTLSNQQGVIRLGDECYGAEFQPELVMLFLSFALLLKIT